MGYGSATPYLSERLTPRKWSSKRLADRRKLLELGTKQAEITKMFKDAENE